LRRDQTDAEKRLWSRLRGRGVGGFKFRRQHPIGRFFVDFFCLEAELVVELDGSQHLDDTEQEEERSKYLRESEATPSCGSGITKRLLRLIM
jgi:very-short-patch-repair endonuclease